MQDVLGPSPAFFLSLLDATWQGIATLAAGGAAASSRQARSAGAAAYLDCLLYALLKADELAAVGGGSEEGSGSGGGTAAGSGDTPGQRFSAELLEAVLDSALVPAALGGGDGVAAQLAAEAEAVLTGAAARLAQQPASAVASPAARQRLDQLLQLVGSRAAAALRAALSEGDYAAVSGLCDRCVALVPALGRAVGPDAAAAVGAAVAQPLVAALLPEVRGGGAPPAASTLLAELLKAFPQHAAAGEAPSPAAPESGAAAAAEPDAAAEQFASLRLHQSASFTIDSIIRQALRLMPGEGRGERCRRRVQRRRPGSSTGVPSSLCRCSDFTPPLLPVDQRSSGSSSRVYTVGWPLPAFL